MSIQEQQPQKKLMYIGGSEKDLLALPEKVRMTFAQALFLAINGDRGESTKVLKGFRGSGVLEIIEHDEGGTYRAVYTVKFEQAVFVLHCFQKKSKRGIETPKKDMELIKQRLKEAEKIAKNMTK